MGRSKRLLKFILTFPPSVDSSFEPKGEMFSEPKCTFFSQSEFFLPLILLFCGHIFSARVFLGRNHLPLREGGSGCLQNYGNEIHVKEYVLYLNKLDVVTN